MSNDGELTDDRWTQYPPHPEHGNIYYPYHIEECSMLRYQVRTVPGVSRSRPLRWTDAVFAAQQLNAGESSPALDAMMLKEG